MAKKKFDPKAKAKRQKVILAVGGVLLLGLLAFQVPRTMKMMKPQDQSASSSPPASTSATAGSTSLAPPSLDGSTSAGTTGSSGGSSAGSSTATSADGVSDPSNPLPPNAGQLVSFSKFKSKDPFHQQILAACQTDPTQGAAAGCATGASTTSGTTSDTGTTTTAGNGTTGTKPAGPTAGGSSSPAAKPTTATISVNGTASTVTVSSTFPSGAPVFTLVSLTKSTAKIGVAGGTYESGAPTVTLKRGKTVTLMNTADGMRYVLRLVSVA